MNQATSGSNLDCDYPDELGNLTSESVETFVFVGSVIREDL